MIIKNPFNTGTENWGSYDYLTNADIPAKHETSGGQDNGGFIWDEYHPWSIDTPESPHSVLAFFTYRKWSGNSPLDLRNAELSVYLRGDNLKLDGARCFFWVLNEENDRWHLSKKPLTIGVNKWGPKQVVVIENDETLWHRSWSRNPATPASLDTVLSKAGSYGFSFVGFKTAVNGKFAMDDFKIRLLDPD